MDLSLIYDHYTYDRNVKKTRTMRKTWKNEIIFSKL